MSKKIRDLVDGVDDVASAGGLQDSNGDTLGMGSIPDNELLRRVGTGIVGYGTGNFAAFSHNHVVADITDLNTGVFSVTGHTHVVADITDLNTGAFAVTGHTHVIADVTDISAFGSTLIDDADASAARTTLEVRNWQSWKLGDETTDATAGVKLAWYAPANGKIHNAFAGCTTSVTVAPLVLDVHKTGVSIFATGLSIDVGENSTATAVSGMALSSDPTSFSAGDKFEFEIDSIGSGAAGLHCDLEFSWD